MQKTVTFLEWKPGRDFDTDSFECSVRFSVADTALVGTPRGKRSVHRIKVIMSADLMNGWNLACHTDLGVTTDMLKVALQSLEEHLVEVLKRGLLTRNELEPLRLTTKSAPDPCPYECTNIRYPDKTSFLVDIDEQSGSSDALSVHPNIEVLCTRMEDALKRKDYAGVLHASASIFETLAKDVVGIPGVQDQTVKAFFQRYRKDSALPDELLDYILRIYESRSATPLAGHGSTRVPGLSREEAISLAEMTKAFVRIEYRCHRKQA